MTRTPFRRLAMEVVLALILAFAFTVANRTPIRPVQVGVRVNAGAMGK